MIYKLHADEDEDKPSSYTLDKTGIRIELRESQDGFVLADVYYDDIPEAEPLSRGLYNGIFLFLTTLLTNEFSGDLLRDTKLLDACIATALDKVEPMVDMLDPQ